MKYSEATMKTIKVYQARALMRQTNEWIMVSK